MSRSRKYPVFKDGPDKYYKKLSNKLIRRFIKKSDVGFKSTKLFKQIVNPWDICDWKWYPTEEDKINESSRK